ncbi:MAG: hypothetical protein Harvfovirus31_7 [Harvfovirus sp.]|uniref:Uncharacterized protein n=1 Tax=Harvfovirus sp. TaxID=2487768 RepID=A0A3G5A579_9VIRU|nr:MAG: hypothetical protein Harvfovirus31_7 [Harvfovirus sp.]
MIYVITETDCFVYRDDQTVTTTVIDVVTDKELAERIMKKRAEEIIKENNSGLIEGESDEELFFSSTDSKNMCEISQSITHEYRCKHEVDIQNFIVEIHERPAIKN